MTRLPVLLVLAAALLPAEEVNAPAPELEMKMEDGQILKLSQLKGKPVLIQFFSTTCPHCQTSAAALDKIVRTYAPKGVQIIAVSTDENQRKEFPEFRRKYGATYRMGTVHREDGYRFFNLSVMRPFYVPSFAFIDKAGILRQKFIGGLQTASPAAEVAEIAKHLDALLKPAATQAKR